MLMLLSLHNHIQDTEVMPVTVIGKMLIFYAKAVWLLHQEFFVY